MKAASPPSTLEVLQMIEQEAIERLHKDMRLSSLEIIGRACIKAQKFVNNGELEEARYALAQALDLTSKQ